MSQSLSKMWSHLIFSTKDRYPFLSDNNVREQLHAYMATILRNHDCPTLQIGGAADHTHALFALSKNLSVAQVVYEVKRSSSKWIKTQGLAYKNSTGRVATERFPSASPMSSRCDATSSGKNNTTAGSHFKMSIVSSCVDMTLSTTSNIFGIDRSVQPFQGGDVMSLFPQGATLG